MLNWVASRQNHRTAPSRARIHAINTPSTSCCWNEGRNEKGIFRMSSGRHLSFPVHLQKSPRCLVPFTPFPTKTWVRLQLLAQTAHNMCVFHHKFFTCSCSNVILKRCMAAGTRSLRIKDGGRCQARISFTNDGLVKWTCSIPKQLNGAEKQKQTKEEEKTRKTTNLQMIFD